MPASTKSLLPCLCTRADTSEVVYRQRARSCERASDMFLPVTPFDLSGTSFFQSRELRGSDHACGAERRRLLADDGLPQSPTPNPSRNTLFHRRPAKTTGFPACGLAEYGAGHMTRGVRDLAAAAGLSAFFCEPLCLRTSP
jgi:hypothetical protein